MIWSLLRPVPTRTLHLLAQPASPGSGDGRKEQYCGSWAPLGLTAKLLCLLASGCSTAAGDVFEEPERCEEASEY